MKKISYESSKWYVKVWRQRWYLYAIFLYTKSFINIDLGLEFITEEELSEETKEDLRQNWKYIKKHVELSKMYKFT